MAMTQAEYARHRGVSRQAIGKLVSSGKLPATAFVLEGGVRKIDPAAADFALGETRERIASGEDDAGGADESFGSNAGSAAQPGGAGVARLTAARTATEIYRARTAELEYEQKIGRLLSREDVVAAMEKCAGVIVRELDGLPNFADDIAAAIQRDGIQGVRLELKKIAGVVRAALEKNMRATASEAETSNQGGVS